MDGTGDITLVYMSVIENVDATFFMCLVDMVFWGPIFLPIFINFYLISHWFDVFSKHLSAAGVVSWDARC